MNIQLYKVRIDKRLNKGQLKGFCTLTIASEVVIHDIAIFVDDKGKFNFRMPQKQFTGADGTVQYANIALPITAVARESILNAIISAYNDTENS